MGREGAPLSRKTPVYPVGDGRPPAPRRQPPTVHHAPAGSMPRRARGNVRKRSHQRQPPRPLAPTTARCRCRRAQRDGTKKFRLQPHQGPREPQPASPPNSRGRRRRSDRRHDPGTPSSSVWSCRMSDASTSAETPAAAGNTARHDQASPRQQTSPPNGAAVEAMRSRRQHEERPSEEFLQLILYIDISHACTVHCVHLIGLKPRHTRAYLCNSSADVRSDAGNVHDGAAYKTTHHDHDDALELRERNGVCRRDRGRRPFPSRGAAARLRGRHPNDQRKATKTAGTLNRRPSTSNVAVGPSSPFHQDRRTKIQRWAALHAVGGISEVLAAREGGRSLRVNFAG